MCRYRQTAWLILATLFLFAGCDFSGDSHDAARVFAAAPQLHQWTGSTMGTHYRISVVEAESQETPFPLALAKSELEQTLQRVNAAMSSYQPDSELSRFNQLPVDQCLPVSDALIEVITASLDVYRRSQGAFNPLVAPLVNRWGFGSRSDALEAAALTDAEIDFPEQAEIDALLRQIDPSHLVLDNVNKRLCKQAELTIDLSAIAKGYGVDQLAATLSMLGASNFLVDIGGEVRVAGHSPRGGPWRLAIEKPQAALNTVQQLIQLTAAAVATSGDYRNYFEYRGRRYSHTIDPHTGFPVTHAIASVSVIADSAMMADAWATALNVAGPEQSKILAREHGLAVFLVQRENDRLNADAGYTSWYSPAFESYLVHE